MKTRVKTNYQRGPLKTGEIQAQVLWWIKRTQQRHLESDENKEDVLRLNLKPNDEGLLECRGRIEGHYPEYIPPKTLLAEKLIMDAHTSSLHGGVGITMTTVRETYWIPRLRYLTKRMIKSCYRCKRFQVTAFPKPPIGNLPKDRTVGERPFQVVGKLTTLVQYVIKKPTPTFC